MVGCGDVEGNIPDLEQSGAMGNLTQICGARVDVAAVSARPSHPYPVLLNLGPRASLGGLWLWDAIPPQLGTDWGESRERGRVWREDYKLHWSLRIALAGDFLPTCRYRNRLREVTCP